MENYLRPYEFFGILESFDLLLDPPGGEGTKTLQSDQRHPRHAVLLDILGQRVVVFSRYEHNLKYILALRTSKAAAGVKRAD